MKNTNKHINQDKIQKQKLPQLQQLQQLKLEQLEWVAGGPHVIIKEE